MATSIEYPSFREGLKQGRLLVQYCLAAGRFQHYPRPLSLYSGRRTLEWRPVTGAGTIHAITTSGTAGDEVLVVVQLVEGVRMLAKLSRDSASTPRIGAAVRFLPVPSSDCGAPVFGLDSAGTP